MVAPSKMLYQVIFKARKLGARKRPELSPGLVPRAGLEPARTLLSTGF